MADYSQVVIETGGIARFTRADHFKSGDTGDAVAQLNAFLIAAGYLTEEELAKQGGDENIVGTGTKNAVIYFQRDQGLPVGDDRNLISADALRGMRTFLRDEGAEVNAEVFTGNAGGRELLDDFGEGVTESFQEAIPKADPTDDDITEPIATGGGDAAGVLQGGKLVKIEKPEQEDVWLQVYEFPEGSGNFIGYQYDDYTQVETVNGTNPAWQGNSEEWFNTKVTVGGTAADNVMGATGNWQELVNDVKANALKAAGVTDPTILSAYLNDPGIADVIASAALGEWTDEQTLAALRKEPYYTDVLYPGIDNYYGKTSNPENAYLMFKQNVVANLESMGVGRDADGTYKTAIGDLLDKGVTDTALASFAPTYNKAVANDAYRESMNQWLVAGGQDPLTDFDSFYDLLAGNTTPEIDEIVELATLSYTAESQGLDFADEVISDLAGATELSDADMARVFSEADRALIALGDKGLRTAGITAQDVLRSRAGLADPSGRTAGEMNSAIAKAARELGIADDPTASIFTDFNREGAPIKKGLQATISEGA